MKFTTAALDSGYVSLILVVLLVGPLLLFRSSLACVCVCLWSYICAYVIRLIRLPLLQIYVLCFILSLTISFGFLFPCYSSFLYFLSSVSMSVGVSWFEGGSRKFKIFILPIYSTFLFFSCYCILIEFFLGCCSGQLMCSLTIPLPGLVKGIHARIRGFTRDSLLWHGPKRLSSFKLTMSVFTGSSCCHLSYPLGLIECFCKLVWRTLFIFP